VSSNLEAIELVPREPVHRLPGCWYVQDSRMLRDLDERTVDALARMSTTASYEPGELLHQAGDPIDAVAFVSSGRVKVYRLSRDGKQQTIAMLGPGDAFGEIGMVDREAQDLYIEALEQTTICRTTRDSFLQLASRNPALAIRLAEAMGEKLQEARERIADFAFRDVRGRVAHLLITLLTRERRLTGNLSRDRFDPGLTHRELADIIGTRRESVTLALNSLARAGLIAIDARELVIRDYQAIQELAQA
jgi:CRP/FNR family cyclic AMP-dependent transcriptional regulator